MNEKHELQIRRSEDGTYIDFSRGNEGVRAWKDECRMIDRNNEDSAWEEKGSAKRFPIQSIRFQGIGPGIPIKTAPYPIANLIGNMESPELDALTTCTRSFDDIMASLFPDYQNRSPVW